VRHIVEPSNEQNLDRLGHEIAGGAKRSLGPTLREAVSNDYESLVRWVPDAAAALRWAGPEVVFPFVASQLEKQIQLSAGRSFVLESEGAPVAFGQYWCPASGTVHLARLIVGPQFRGRGFWRALCLQLIDAGASATGATRFTLRVYQDNEAAVALYRSLGFEVVPQGSDDRAYLMCRGGA
jgi:ribosomal protein S18 acetylase RimI-like enzyme